MGRLGGQTRAPSTRARYIWRIFRRLVAIALRAIFQPSVEDGCNPELLPADSNWAGYLAILYPRAECPGGYSQELCDLIVIIQFVHEPFSGLPLVPSKASGFIPYTPRKAAEPRRIARGGEFAAGPSLSGPIGLKFSRFMRVPGMPAGILCRWTCSGRDMCPEPLSGVPDLRLLPVNHGRISERGSMSPIAANLTEIAN